MITSYAVVGGGSHICVSVGISYVYGGLGAVNYRKNGVGTYCLDTVSHTWSKVGDWTLPFAGKVEYVPELKLWFGISGSEFGSGNGQLAAADLSAMDSTKPELVGTWEEETDVTAMEQRSRRRLDPEMREHRLAYLGSGRFCITRFFADGHHLSRERFAVLTGVEVTPQAHGGSRDDGGEAKLQMIRHKSRLVPSDTCVDAVF